MAGSGPPFALTLTNTWGVTPPTPFYNPWLSGGPAPLNNSGYTYGYTPGPQPLVSTQPNQGVLTGLLELATMGIFTAGGIINARAQKTASTPPVPAPGSWQQLTGNFGGGGIYLIFGALAVIVVTILLLRRA
jgi:hypothetical protein